MFNFLKPRITVEEAALFFFNLIMKETKDDAKEIKRLLTKIDSKYKDADEDEILLCALSIKTALGAAQAANLFGFEFGHKIKQEVTNYMCEIDNDVGNAVRHQSEKYDAAIKRRKVGDFFDEELFAQFIRDVTASDVPSKDTRALINPISILAICAVFSESESMEFWAFIKGSRRLI